MNSPSHLLPLPGTSPGGGTANDQPTTGGVPVGFTADSQAAAMTKGADGSSEVSKGEAGDLPPFPVPWRHPLRCMWWLAQALFGLGSLIFLLAVLAVVPVVNFLTLGYLLEAEGRVARSGRLRDGFPLFKTAPRIGSICLGIWLWLLPLRLLAGWAGDARIIDPGSPADLRLQRLLSIAWVLVTVHLCLALARGGSLSCFVRPFKNLFWLIGQLRSGHYLDRAAGHVRDFVHRLRLWQHFSLGVRGFVGAFTWLVLPSVLYFAPREQEGLPVLLTVLGGVLLVIVHAWVPFLQARLAAENRLTAAFELQTTRELFRHAPLTWGIALVLLYVLALPLYLFKAFVLPADALWTVAILFIVTIYPTKLLLGWAYHRAVARREQGRRAPRWVCWLVRLGVIVPALSVYVFVLYFTQFLGEAGKLELLRHHAFLLPLHVR